MMVEHHDALPRDDDDGLDPQAVDSILADDEVHDITLRECSSEDQQKPNLVDKIADEVNNIFQTSKSVMMNSLFNESV